MEITRSPGTRRFLACSFLYLDNVSMPWHTIRTMHIETKKLQKSQLELTVVLAVDEMKPFVDAAAVRIAAEKTIEGFRPGKAPVEVVTARVGEMAVLEAAAEDAVKKTYARAVADGKWLTIGAPQIQIVTLAPGNPFTFKATVSLLPAVERLADYKMIRVASKPVEVTDAQVDGALRELQKMRTKETAADREVRAGDKVTVDMKMFLDKVPIEGGDAKSHAIYLDEPYFIPGFKDKLLGMKKNETREFSLPFPKEHYRKNLAGKNVEFSVSAKEVFELAPPALDDSFAASVGQKTIPELRELIRKNLEHEAADKENDRIESEITKQLVSGSRFGDIPETMVNREAERMILELEHAVSGRGLEFNQYLQSINKKISDLQLEFAPRAVERIKTAIAIREVAAREGINPTEAEVADTIAEHISKYADDPEMQEHIRKPEYAELIRINLRNAKTVEFLKKAPAGSA